MSKNLDSSFRSSRSGTNKIPNLPTGFSGSRYLDLNGDQYSTIGSSPGKKISRLSLAPRSPNFTEHTGILQLDDGSPTNQQNAEDIRRDLQDLESTRSITKFLEDRVLGKSNPISRCMVAGIATAYRWASWVWYHGWTFFDTFIVVCSFVDIIWLLAYAGASDELGAIASFRMLRIMRVFRTVKLLRYLLDM